MRKQRRQAELQDKRDRIRMGLVPPDAPKGSGHFNNNICYLFTLLTFHAQFDCRTS